MDKRIRIYEIKDYAVINLNNMIPVPVEQIIEMDINKETDSSYRCLLQAENRGAWEKCNMAILYTHKI